MVNPASRGQKLEICKILGKVLNVSRLKDWIDNAVRRQVITLF